MKNFFKILFNHKWAIIMAILIGVIIAFPQVYFQITQKDSYKGIALGGTSDENIFLVRIQEVRDGHYLIANSSWAEGKDLPYLPPPLSENIISFIGQIFRLNLINTITFSRFVFPIIVFLLIYALLYQLSKRKSIALVASTTVLLSINLANPMAIWNLLIYKKTYTDFMLFSRLVSPVNLIFFFGFLLLFWLYLQKKNRIYGISSGIILGLSFYSYPYTWTFLFAFLGCLALIYLYKKEWIKIKNIALTVSVALLVSIPYFLNLWQAMHHPLYLEIASRFGLIKTHSPQVGVLVLILLSIFLLFFSREWKDRYYFCLGLVLTPFIVLNQQVITGIIMIPDHYHWYYHSPLAIIIVIIIIFELFDKKINRLFLKKMSWLSLVILILFINFYNAWMIQTSFYQHREPIAIKDQRYGPVFEWLRNNTQKDQVIMGDETTSCLISIYTPLNTVSCEDGHHTLIADEQQLIERIFLIFRLNRLKGDDAQEYFFKNRANLSSRIYVEYYRKKMGSYGSIQDKKLNFLVDKYKEFLDISLESLFRRYQVDYLIWDTLKHPEWQIEQYLFFEQIYEINEFKVFKLK